MPPEYIDNKYYWVKSNLHEGYPYEIVQYHNGWFYMDDSAFRPEELLNNYIIVSVVYDPNEIKDITEKAWQYDQLAK